MLEQKENKLKPKILELLRATNETVKRDGCAASFLLEVRRLDNLRPASDVALHESGKRLLTAARLVRDFEDEVDEPLAPVLVVQSLVEGIGEFVEDRFRRRLGSKQGEPSQYLELRQARFLRG